MRLRCNISVTPSPAPGGRTKLRPMGPECQRGGGGFMDQPAINFTYRVPVSVSASLSPPPRVSVTRQPPPSPGPIGPIGSPQPDAASLFQHRAESTCGALISSFDLWLRPPTRPPSLSAWNREENAQARPEILYMCHIILGCRVINHTCQGCWAKCKLFKEGNVNGV